MLEARGSKFEARCLKLEVCRSELSLYLIFVFVFENEDSSIVGCYTGDGRKEWAVGRF